jgi:hypothetical protein
MVTAAPSPTINQTKTTEVKELPLLFIIILVLHILPLLASFYILIMYFIPNSYFAENSTLQNTVISLFINSLGAILTLGAYFRNRYALILLLIFPFLRLILNIFIEDKQSFNLTTSSLSAFLISGLLLFSIRKHWSSFR